MVGFLGECPRMAWVEWDSGCMILQVFGVNILAWRGFVGFLLHHLAGSWGSEVLI